MTPLPRAAAAARLAAFDAPVLLLDACALLDIVRGPVRDHFGPAEGAAVHHLLSRAEAAPPRLCLLVSEQVVDEFGRNVAAVEAETEEVLIKMTAAMRDTVGRMTALAGAMGLPGSFDVPNLMALGFPTLSRALADRLLCRSTVLRDEDDAKLGAMDRVQRAIAPAKHGKNSTMDCLIAETCLRTAAAVREAGVQHAVVFLTAIGPVWWTVCGLGGYVVVRAASLSAS